MFCITDVISKVPETFTAFPICKHCRQNKGSKSELQVQFPCFRVKHVRKTNESLFPGDSWRLQFVIKLLKRQQKKEKGRDTAVETANKTSQNQWLPGCQGRF